MAEVTQEMILDYLTKKGGLVRNVDLVRHFKKYLQFESEPEKDRARVIFKERVNKVAFIKADSKKEKYLHLRSEFYPPGGLTRPPTGRSITGSDHSSVSSLEDGGSRSAADTRFSFSSIPTDLKSPGPESDLVFNSFTSKPSPPPVVTTIPPAQQQRAPPTSSQQQRALPTSSQQRAPPTSSQQQRAPPTSSQQQPNSGKTRKMDDDFGASLMAELNSFGSILDSFDSFGLSGLTSSASPPSSSSAQTSVSASYSTPAVGSTTHSTSSSSPYSSAPTGHTPASTGHAHATQNSYSNYSANPAPQRSSVTNSTPQTSWSSTPQSSSAHSTPLRSAVAPPTTKSSSVSPQRTTYSSPYKSVYSTPPKTSSSSYETRHGGNGDMDLDLGSVLSSLPSAAGSGVASKKPAVESVSKKPASGTMDLSDVLSSLPSAKGSGTASKKPTATNSAGKKATSDSMDLSDLLSGLPSAKSGSKTTTAPGNSRPVGNSMGGIGGGQQYGRTEPPKAQPTQPAYHNSTGYNQPKQPPYQNNMPSHQNPVQQSSYQTSMQFDQPKAQPSYQNNTQVDQLKLQSAAYQNSAKHPLQNSYQNSTQPLQNSSYQNSTRFDQPKVQTTQGSYQNSTRFDQPKAPQPSYQNSTRFDQPQLQQPSYQNSTRFDQPRAQPAYQNSTRFDQPPPQQPSYQNNTSQPSYQNSTRFDQPKASQVPGYQHSFEARPGSHSTSGGQFIPPSYQATPTPRYDPLSVGGLDHIRALQPSPRASPQPSDRSSHQPTDQQSTATQNAAGGIVGPAAPKRTSSISQKNRDSGTSISSNTRRAAPPPPVQAPPQATPPTGPSPVVFSPKQATSPSAFQSNIGGLGGLDLGDFSSSMFSAGSAPSSTHHGTPTTTDHTSNSTHASNATSNPSSTYRTVSGPTLDPAPGSTHHTRPDATEGTSDTTHPYSHNLGPSVSLPPRSQLDRRDTSRRQGSIDSVPGTPSIKIDTPAASSANPGSPSRRARSPPHDATSRGRASSGSSGSITMATAGIVAANAGLGVQLRNKDAKGGGRGQNAARRSKNFDKNANLDNFTRLSISMTPPSVRKHRPPEVAPKPLRTASPSSSHDDSAQMQDGDEDLHSEYDYEEIDPLEKEWMLASAQADIDGLQRLMMTDPTLLNRKGFLHGYTALHWAAKHGRMDILSMLLLQGAATDIKSTGGLTPLHLAAQAGHDNILEVLIIQHNANINLRENGGRRAIDMLNNRASEKVKVLLSRLDNHGLPIRVESSVLPATFSRSRAARSSLDRNWKSLGELSHQNAVAIEKDKASRKKHLSPRSAIKKSFSFKKSLKIKEGTMASPKRQKKGSRPMSDAAAHRYDV